MWACELLLLQLMKWHSARSLWRIFLHLPSEHLSHCIPLWGSERSPRARVKEFPDLWQFSSFMTPFPVQVSIPNSFVSHFVFIFCSTSFQGDWFAFLKVWGPLLVFSRCSVGIVPQADGFLIYLMWRRRWSHHFISPNHLLKLPPLSCFFIASWIQKCGKIPQDQRKVVWIHLHSSTTDLCVDLGQYTSPGLNSSLLKWRGNWGTENSMS